MSIASLVKTRVLITVASAGIVPLVVRRRLLGWCGIHVPPNGGLRERFLIDGARLTIGPGTWINSRCHFDCTAEIAIGARCNIGPGVMFLTATHTAGDETRRAGLATSAPIVVGDGTWIGARATILSGVTVAAGCIVAAGAVVTRDTEPNGLYAGIPAVRIRDLPSAADSDPREAAMVGSRRRATRSATAD